MLHQRPISNNPGNIWLPLQAQVLREGGWSVQKIAKEFDSSPHLVKRMIETARGVMLARDLSALWGVQNAAQAPPGFRHKQAAALREAGLKWEYIGAALGVTTARARQMVRKAHQKRV